MEAWTSAGVRASTAYAGRADGDPACPSLYCQFTYIILLAFLYSSLLGPASAPPTVLFNPPHVVELGQQGDPGRQKPVHWATNIATK
jgi:hypothetical protein